jgi:hypothetical protein
MVAALMVAIAVLSHSALLSHSEETTDVSSGLRDAKPNRGTTNNMAKWRHDTASSPLPPPALFPCTPHAARAARAARAEACAANDIDGAAWPGPPAAPAAAGGSPGVAGARGCRLPRHTATDRETRHCNDPCIIRGHVGAGRSQRSRITSTPCPARCRLGRRSTTHPSRASPAHSGGGWRGRPQHASRWSPSPQAAAVQHAAPGAAARGLSRVLPTWRRWP